MTDLLTQVSIQRLPGKLLPRIGIGQKIAATFFLVLVFAITNIAIVKNQLDGFNDVVATVNIAGNLRWTSQRLAFRTVGLSVGATAGILNINQDIHALNRNIQALKQGGIVDGLEIRPLGLVYQSEITAVEEAWNSYRIDLERSVAAYTPTTDVASEDVLFDSTRRNVLIMTGSTNMLKVSEGLMSVIVIESERRQNQALFSMYMLLFQRDFFTRVCSRVASELLCI